MLTISVELLHGTFRGDPDGTANTGGLKRGEWPPSPARLFAALVAADGTQEKCQMTNCEGEELAWFERLPPPEIFAHATPCHQILQPRYVVRHEGRASRATHHEYIARSGALNRPGVRVSPRYPEIFYSWDVEPPEKQKLDALQIRAARVGYLGCADSPVRLRIVASRSKPRDWGDSFVPDEQGGKVINVTAPGDTELLDRKYKAWIERGASVTRQQFPALRHGARYRLPKSPAPIDHGKVVAWLRLGTAISGRRVAVVTQLFKEAILSQHQKIHGEPPAVLHGHGFNGKGYELARYLALPDVGHRHSRGRIHGLALWMPSGCDEIAYRMARDAAFEVRHLTGRGVSVSATPRDDEDRPFAAHPNRWCKESRGWVTAFPAIHERRCAPDLAEVSRWCRHAGLPEPLAVRSTRTPLVPGALDLMPVEVNRPNRAALAYSHLELWFPEKIAGPVVIGSGRQRGFGLCVQVDENSQAGQ